MLRPSKTSHKHLREAEILGPRDTGGLVLAQLLHREVAADAGEAGIVEDAAQLCAGEFLEAAKATVSVANRRAELDGAETGGGELAQRAGKVLSDGLADRPGLAADGEAEWIGEG